MISKIGLGILILCGVAAILGFEVEIIRESVRTRDKVIIVETMVFTLILIGFALVLIGKAVGM